MTRLTQADRAEALAAIETIKTRPAYSLATAWLDRVKAHYPEHIGTRDEFQSGWVTVGWLQNALQRCLGVHIAEDTLAVALEVSGFKVRSNGNGNGWAECNLAEQVLLDCVQQHGTFKGLTAMSDPTDAHLGMH